jgi:hypothetical protein
MESVQLVKSTLEYYSKDSATYSQYLHLWDLMLMFKEENMNPISRYYTKPFKKKKKKKKN